MIGYFFYPFKTSIFQLALGFSWVTAFISIFMVLLVVLILLHVILSDIAVPSFFSFLSEKFMSWGMLRYTRGHLIQLVWFSRGMKSLKFLYAYYRQQPIHGPMPNRGARIALTVSSSWIFRLFSCYSYNGNVCRPTIQAVLLIPLELMQIIL